MSANYLAHPWILSVTLEPSNKPCTEPSIASGMCSQNHDFRQQHTATRTQARSSLRDAICCPDMRREECSQTENYVPLLLLETTANH
jgi:hypothetical protein